MKGLQVRKDRLRLRAEDEADRVNPVRADVADGAELATLAGEESPVVVRGLEQPVLEEVALDVDDLAEVAALDERAHLEHGGEEPAHIVHGKDRRAFLLHGGHHLRRLLRRHAQRLLADDVLARRERGEGLLDMDFVRRGDVDDIHVRRREHRGVVVVAIDLGDAPLGGSGLGVLR